MTREEYQKKIDELDEQKKIVERFTLPSKHGVYRLLAEGT